MLAKSVTNTWQKGRTVDVAVLLIIFFKLPYYFGYMNVGVRSHHLQDLLCQCLKYLIVFIFLRYPVKFWLALAKNIPSQILVSVG
jgi:hypothetical protein